MSRELSEWRKSEKGVWEAWLRALWLGSLVWGTLAETPGSGHFMAEHRARYTLTFAHKAPDVEVLVLHTQHLSLAHIPTGITQDRSAGWLLQWGMSSLGLRHCQEKGARLK